MRILLIGAGGQVGRELLARLACLGHVVATVRQPASDAALAGCLPLELGDAGALRSLVRDVRPRAIVNAAAYTAVDRAETEPDLALAINADMPRVAAEEARRIGALLLHYSTDYVYDGSGEQLWREADPTAPLNVYGATKLAGESAIAATRAAHLIIRTSWVYGATGNNFVRTMLRLGSQRDELRVVCDQIGAPTSAALIAAATTRLLRRAFTQPTSHYIRRGDVVHLCAAGHTSWHGLAEQVFRLASAHGLELAVRRVLPIGTHEYPTPAERPLNSRLDLSRLRRRYGIRPPTWQTALALSIGPLIETARSTRAAA